MLIVGLAGLSLTGCRDQDFDWEEAKSQNPEYVFRSNFEKLVGEIDPNQSWDLSRGAKKSGTRGTGDDQIIPTDENGWYEIDQRTIQYLIDNLPEGQDNKSKGTAFTLNAPDNGFAVIPLYQGGASYYWELHMVTLNADGNVVDDETLWNKNKDLECQLTEQTIANDVSYNIANQRDYSSTDPTAKMSVRNTNTWYSTKQSFRWDEKENKWLNEEFGWRTDGASRVRTKPIVPQSSLESGQSLYFYLKVWKNPGQDGSGIKDENKKPNASSIDHMMIYLSDCPSPSNLNKTPNGSTKEVMIIGCEDNKDSGSDWDMDDFAFMIVGYPNVPIPHEITETEEITKKKRYMVEDLGSLAETDVDFNDIVVDFEEYHSITKTTSSTGVTNIIPGETKQRAIFRAMGETLDFDFYIKKSDRTKEVLLRKSSKFTYSQMINTVVSEAPIDYNMNLYSVEIPNNIWEKDGAANNIGVTVIGRTAPDVVYDKLEDAYRTGEDVSVPGTTTIEFPENGAVPFIIAFDPSKQWREERQAICYGWLFGDEENCSHDKNTIEYPEVK